MAKYTAVFTTYGTQVLANAIANNQPLRVTHFAVGDGNGREVTVSASQERLVNEKHRAAISAVSLDPRNNKQVIFELTIPENVGGFYIREMGVFDANNKLVAYANCPESFKPTLASGSGKVQVMRMILLVASSNAITITVDDSVIFVTRGQLTPQTITATSSNGFDQNGHSHEIDKASTTKAGIVQLTNDTGLDSEALGLTAKAGKLLAQGIAALRLALNNYIPNSKKSNAVNSNSAETVASSAAVKTAYDKATEAKNAADNAQRTADGKQSPATTLSGYGIGNFKIEPFVGNLNTLKTDGIYAITQASRSQNLPVSTSCHIEVIAGGDGAWCRQLAYVAYSTDIYERHQTSYQADSWSAWIKVDSLDRVHKAELVGEVAFFARSTPPAGWLKANGAEVSRATYAALFAAIGTTFGAGNGSTTFNLPDLRGEFIRGVDDGRNVDSGRGLGTAQGDAIKTHTINVPNSGYEGNVLGSWFYAELGNGNNSQRTNTITYNGENETRPRNVALLACIKY